MRETVDAVTVPTASGEVGILQNHAPLISALRAGILSYTKSGATERLAIAGGFLEVSQNNVSVLADTAERADEIDVDAARAERESVERELSQWKGSEAEFETEKERLEKAQADYCSLQADKSDNYFSNKSRRKLNLRRLLYFNRLKRALVISRF